MEEVQKRNKNFQTKESEEKGRNFKPKETDIFVVTYPKCGTTWMTQILHSLRSNCDMSFNEITEVVPWDVLALDCGQDVNAEQSYTPRLFKSHESFNDIALSQPMAKYIFVCRDPFDAFVSFYKFLPSYMNVSLDRVSMMDFANGLFGGASNSGIISSFYFGWFQALKKYPSNVHWIFFEDLKKDLGGQIRKINKWLGMDTSEETILKTIEQSKFEFMKAHKSKFDDHFLFNKRKKALGLEHLDKPAVAKVREGSVGSKTEIPDDVKQLIETDWRDNFEWFTKIENYQQLKKTVDEIQNE